MAVSTGLAIAGLVTAGVGLYDSYMKSEAAREVDEATRQAIGDALKIYEKNIQYPNIDPTPLTVEQLTLLGKYTPKVAAYIQEKHPQMVTESNSQDLINRQKQALDEYTQLSRSGEDAIGAAQREQGMSEAAGVQRRNTEALLKQYQNQGIGTGGQALIAAQNAGQQADEMRRKNAIDVAAQNQQRRLQALGQMTNLAGSMRGQNQNIEQANVNAINAFNTRNSTTKQNWENQQAATQNNAQMYNMDAAQNVANSNVALRNANNMANRNRADMIERENRLAKNEANTNKLNASTGQAASNRAMDQDRLARDAAFTQQALGTATNAINTGVGSYEKAQDRDLKSKELDTLAQLYGKKG